MNRLKIAGLIAVGCSLATAAHADAVNERSYFFLDAFAVQHEERIPERETGFGGRFGLGLPVGHTASARTSIEAGLFTNPIRIKSGDSGDQMGLMVDLVHTFDFQSIDPYVFAGVGVVREEIGTAVAGNNPALEAGAGVVFEAFDDGFVRVGLSAQSVHNDDIRADQDKFVDLRFNIGLVLPFADAPAAPPPAPAPAKVVDSDGDGLADAQDKCPSTPASTADGCPPPAPVVQTDSDNDGVYDSQDQCAGTLEGLKVDAAGCAVQTEAQSVVLKGVTFLPSSATLTPEAKTVLDASVAALAGQKDLKVELGGHTDSQGKDAANMALSQKRAESARQYLIGRGIEAERLTAKGYGETQPIADNNTLEGRKENRRVELKIIK